MGGIIESSGQQQLLQYRGEKSWEQQGAAGVRVGAAAARTGIGSSIECEGVLQQ